VAARGASNAMGYDCIIVTTLANMITKCNWQFSRFSSFSMRPQAPETPRRFESKQ
jgi:hypothetical protein